MRYGGGERNMVEYRAEDWVEVPCSTGARVFMHRDFFDPKVRADITRHASQVAEEIGRKCGYRLMTQEEWDEENRAKEKAPCAAATAQGEDR